MKQFETIYFAKYILTMNEKMEIIENGAIGVNGSKIAWIGSQSEIHDLEILNKIDFGEQILMPGLWNGHTHIAMSFFRGVADDLPLMTWLNKYIWPLEQEFISPQFVRDSAYFGIADLIKNGIIFFNDMYFFEHEIAKVADEVGVRALLGEGILSFPVAQHENARAMIDYNINGAEKYKDNDRINFALAPHAIYTCNTDDLKAIQKASKEHDLKIHIHISETEQEVKDSHKNFGASPIHYLHSLGLLNENLIGAHGVWVTDEERKLLRENNCNIVFNMESNLKLGSGIPPIASYFKQKVNCMFGTDGVASNNNLDLLEEIATTAKIQKGLLQDATACPAEDLIKSITIDSARIFGYDDVSGSLEIGKDADFITLELDPISDYPMFNIYSHLLYVLNGKNIKNTYVKNKCLMKNRILQTINMDLTKLMHEYTKKIKRFI